MRTIDVAFFECPTCGHRSTSPEAINVMPNQMDLYGYLNEGASENSVRGAMQAKHRGNNVTFRKEGHNRTAVVLERSYAKVTQQDATELSESKHIVLACPECDTLLYEVYFR